MTESNIVSKSKIDTQLERVLTHTKGDGLDLAREVIDEPDDRWYGKLVINSYVSLTGTPGGGGDNVLSAAAAIELLRGYVRLRSQLLIQHTDERVHSLTLDHSSALLAGDYLHTAAFTALSSNLHPTLENCIEILADVSETITETFALSYASAASSEPDPRLILDGTAGSIGKSAALLGATMANIESTHRKDVASVGRGFSTTRQIRRLFDAEPPKAMIVPLALDEVPLQEHAERRRSEAEQALKALSGAADVATLRTLAEAKSK
jgi:geranylgeranyl pyrophosphate synthase